MSTAGKRSKSAASPATPEIICTIEPGYSQRISEVTGSVATLGVPSQYAAINIKVRTEIDSKWDDYVWIDVRRVSNMEAEEWGTSHEETIVLRLREVDTVVATLNAVVAEARKSGVLPAPVGT